MTSSASPKRQPSPADPADSSADSPETAGSPPDESPAPGSSTASPSLAGMTPEEAVARMSQHRGVKILLETPGEVARADGEEDLTGLYELVAMFWDEPYIVVTPNPITGAMVEEMRYRRHRKGDLVMVEHAQAKRLLAAGALVQPGAREARIAEQAEAQARAAAATAKAARAALQKVQAAAEQKQSILEQWREGAAVGEERRAQAEAEALEAWENRPQTHEELLRGAGLT